MQAGIFAGCEDEAAKHQRPAHDDANMKAGDGKQVCKAGCGESRAIRWRDPRGDAGEQRHADRTCRPRNNR